MSQRNKLNTIDKKTRSYFEISFPLGCLKIQMITSCFLFETLRHPIRSLMILLNASSLLMSPKVLYLIFTIVLLFWACFLPFWIWQLLGQFNPKLPLSSKAKRNINYLTTCLTYSNSCINPFLYTLLTKNYKEYMRKHKRSWSAGSYFNRSRFQRSPRRSPSASSQQCTESFMLTHTASLRTHNSTL